MIRLEMTDEQFKELLMQTQEGDEPLFSILSDKIAKMVKRQLFTEYKTTEDPAERSQALHKYLEANRVPDYYWKEY